jgi:ABC-type lipoprotein release transport system permease subunit
VWRLVFQLVRAALHGKRETFARLVALVLLFSTVVGVLVVLLGPYVASGMAAVPIVLRALRPSPPGG